jgi:hypothetical protein
MTPADKFIADLLRLANSTSKFGINPDDEEEYIIDDAVAIEMHPVSDNPSYIHFISVRALDPSKGHGSRAMKKVMDLIDKNAITLLGKIIPYHTQDLSKEKLRSWYRKMDCHPLDPANEEGLWVRAPGGGHTNIKIGPITTYKILNGYSEDDYLGRKIVFGVLLLIGLIILYRKRR